MNFKLETQYFLRHTTKRLDAFIRRFVAVY